MAILSKACKPHSWNPSRPFIKGRAVEFLKFLKKEDGSYFFHKKGGVGKIGGLFKKRGAMTGFSK